MGYLLDFLLLIYLAIGFKYMGERHLIQIFLKALLIETFFNNIDYTFLACLLHLSHFLLLGHFLMKRGVWAKAGFGCGEDAVHFWQARQAIWTWLIARVPCSAFTTVSVSLWAIVPLALRYSWQHFNTTLSYNILLFNLIH